MSIGERENAGTSISTLGRRRSCRMDLRLVHGKQENTVRIHRLFVKTKRGKKNNNHKHTSASR
jgi:hypothetical protein